MHQRTDLERDQTNREIRVQSPSLQEDASVPFLTADEIKSVRTDGEHEKEASDASEARARAEGKPRSVADLIFYVRANREHKRLLMEDEHSDVYEFPSSQELMLSEQEETRAVEKRTLSTVALSMKDLLKASLLTWFDSSASDKAQVKRSFPLSAFAAAVVVAVSLMLIVASTVLLTRAQSDVFKLKQEIDAEAVEIAELRSDLEIKNDLLQIREIAVNEYGMVSEEYLRMQYLDLGAGDSIEVFEKEEDEVGLGALLSAIGIKK